MSVKSHIEGPSNGLIAEVRDVLDAIKRLAVEALQAGLTSDGQLVAIQVDAGGRVVTAPISGGSNIAGFALGDITTSALGTYAVRRTTYTEQTSNAQRSFKSSSASDAAAGTGARTLSFTYYTAAFLGPFTETLTLNGTTPVNTINTDICYIDQIKVLTAGSGGSNAGTITMNAAAGGLGAVIGTVGIGDNQTYWCHRYVPIGKTAHVTAQWAGHNGTVVGSGSTFIVRARRLNISGAVETQISDSFRLYGQSSSVQRNYGTALEVVGPAIILTYAIPETSSSVNYRASFDFYMDDTA